MKIDTQEVIVERDIVFGRGGARDLLCDVYRPPAGGEKGMAIVQIHGGGFRGGAKEGVRTARVLAALGYVQVATQYRLAGEAKWPAQIEDVKACIRWTRANAGRLGIDPAKIAVAGYSAGGHLALVAAGSQNLPAFEGDGGNAGVPTDLAACIAFYPPAALNRRSDGAEHALMRPDSSDEEYRGASPISYVAPGYPPTILLHGAADTTIPIDASFRLYDALTEVAVPVELHAFEGLAHIFDAHAEFGDLSALLIDLFLDRHVVRPRQYEATMPVGVR